MPPLVLSPSSDPSALVTAIARATRAAHKLVLQPGTYPTLPGRGVKISIGANGLTISGPFAKLPLSTIRRPDAAIDLEQPDNNYGLFFVPEKPSDAEWEAITQWQNSTNASTQYAIITRGSIRLENLQIDCNMGNQGLHEQMPSATIEHSAMVGFAGKSFTHRKYPGKTLYVGFKEVILKNIVTLNGGYADDIWFSRGYFRPNIESVLIQRISSKNRINRKRASISFSGLAQKIEISQANIFRLEAEESMLGLEVADLQDAIDLGLQARPAAGERQFRFGQRQVFQPLSIVEVR